MVIPRRFAVATKEVQIDVGLLARIAASRRAEQVQMSHAKPPQLRPRAATSAWLLAAPCSIA